MSGMWKLAAVAVTPLMLAACDSAATDGDQVTAGDYQLLSMGGQDVEDMHVTLLLAEGQISGAGFCNSYSGTQAAALPALDIGTIAATRRACVDDRMAMDKTYFDALAAADMASSADGKLTITGAGPELVFEPHTPDQ